MMLLPAFIMFILPNFSALVTGQGLPYCIDDAGNYTTNNNSSAYLDNLKAVLSSVTTNIGDTGFYNASAGQYPDTVHATALCRGDVQLSVCRRRIRELTIDLLESCLYRKQAIIWEEICTIRYSNETLFGIMATKPAMLLINVHNVTTTPGSEWFRRDLRTLLDNIKNQAVYGDSQRKVAYGNLTGLDFKKTYALIQCTPDITPDACSACLDYAFTLIPSSNTSSTTQGIRVLCPSCNIRYERYTFFNETRLQELAAWTKAEPPGTDNGGSSGTSTTIIIVIVSVTGFLMIVAAFVGILLRKRTKRNSNNHRSTHAADGMSTIESLQYDFATIRAATNDFSDNNMMGQGGFGSVYKGQLPNDQKMIAVKRLSKNSMQGVLEFKNEVLLLARLQHRNLVRLLGFCIDRIEKLLVYEFVPNASLDLFIFDPIKHLSLDWDKRYGIIRGIARGILYLHEDSRLRIIHRDLKASNILLDQEMKPKIADFGMAILFGEDELKGSTSRIVGTYGYMPPEYAIYGEFSIKSDVFSFGVLVMEIISGKKNSSFQRDMEYAGNLLTYAWKNWHEGTGINIMNPFLRSESNSMSNILRCIHVALLCVQENADDRPTMDVVVNMLNSFSWSLAVPSQPAYYMSSKAQNHYSGSSSKSQERGRSDQLSYDASITKLHPR